MALPFQRVIKFGKSEFDKVIYSKIFRFLNKVALVFLGKLKVLGMALLFQRVIKFDKAELDKFLGITHSKILLHILRYF